MPPEAVEAAIRKKALKDAAKNFLNYVCIEAPEKRRCVDMLGEMLALIDSDAGEAFLKNKKSEMGQKITLANSLLNFLKAVQYMKRTGELPKDSDSQLVLAALKTEHSSPLSRSECLFEALSDAADATLVELKEKMQSDPTAMPRKDFDQTESNLNRSFKKFSEASALATIITELFQNGGLRAAIDNAASQEISVAGKAG